MSYLSFWGAVALGVDWWATGRDARRVVRLVGATVAAAGGMVLGSCLGAWLPPPGATLLGAGMLGYLGLFHAAEAGDVALRTFEERDGLAARALVAATGLALAGLTDTVTFLWLLGGMGGGLAAAHWRAGTPGFRRRLRVVAAVLFCGLSLVTFRGVT